MIKNQKQAKATATKISQLINDRDAYVKANKSEEGKAKYRLALNGFNGLIDELKSQLDQYEKLTTGAFNQVVPHLHSFPEALIAARLAQKISQGKLAELTGLKEQQIQRYEITDYEGASHSRMVDIAAALELNCTFKETWYIKNEVSLSFDLPQGVSQLDMNNMTETIRENGSICIK